MTIVPVNNCISDISQFSKLFKYYNYAVWKVAYVTFDYKENFIEDYKA